VGSALVPFKFFERGADDATIAAASSFPPFPIPNPAVGEHLHPRGILKKGRVCRNYVNVLSLADALPKTTVPARLR
jgi:hypothetical protein